MSVAEPGLAFHLLVVYRFASYVDCCLLGSTYGGFGYTLFDIVPDLPSRGWDGASIIEKEHLSHRQVS